MGAGKSKMGAYDSVLNPDSEKNDLFITIFIRLLTKTDIIDIHSLTKGPGACGSYVVLLEQDLSKEFKKLKLETAISGKGVQSFLYTKSKNVSTESPTDSIACREWLFSIFVYYSLLAQ